MAWVGSKASTGKDSISNAREKSCQLMLMVTNGKRYSVVVTQRRQSQCKGKRGGVSLLTGADGQKRQEQVQLYGQSRQSCCKHSKCKGKRLAKKQC